MKNLTKALAAIMLTVATLFVVGCKEDDIALIPQPPQPDWVDLGLPSGLLWASRNVGANTQEEYGDCFAWGETQPKTEYGWFTYRFCSNGDYLHLTKYTNTDTILQPEDDAATANWGGGARIPTKAEWTELFTYTSKHDVYRNEVYGKVFIGANGNSIFLPNARNQGSNYWSSSLNTDDFYYLTAWALCFDRFMQAKDRYWGFSVRAVRQN